MEGPLPSPQVLVVDDDQNVRETIRDVLLLEDIPVVVLEPRPSVLERVRSGEFQLIITDLNMPEIDGLDLVRTAAEASKELGREIPVFVVTGVGGESRAQEAVALGAAGFFPKPFDLDTFLGEIQGTLARLAAG